MAQTEFQASRSIVRRSSEVDGGSGTSSEGLTSHGSVQLL
jgi:hypothetical protein